MRRFNDAPSGFSLADLYARSAPIALSSTVVPQSGVTAKFDLSALQPRNQAPLVVDEIHFELITPEFQSGGNFLVDIRGQMRIRLQAGPHAMTNGFVPIWLLAPPIQDGAEICSKLDTLTRAANYLRWKLPEPMYLPSGYVVNATLFRDPAVDAAAEANNIWLAADTGFVTLSLHGRILDPSVKVLESVIPYVSAATFDTFGIFSGEQDLKNTIDTPIRVQRLIGRVQQTTATAVSDAFHTIGGSNYLVNTIKDSKGYNVINQPTPWWAIFPPERKSWTFQRILPPNEQFIVGLGSTPSIALQPMISFVGSRTETVG